MPAARAGGRSLRRCDLCWWWKLTEELPAPDVPSRVLKELADQPRACLSRTLRVRDLLMPQSGIFTLMRGDVA